MSKIYEIIGKLKRANIHFYIASHRDDAIMLIASVPGQRWEIEIFADQSIEIEVFTSNGEIEGESSLENLINGFAD